MANIGKNVIENLTTGMYDNPLSIYREYIQNAADSIDKSVKTGLMKKEDAIIDIYIDSDNHYASITDTACGIANDKFYKTLSTIADSSKDRTQEKGFRGIGRLAGLAYCEKLIFTSSYPGEKIKSIMIWNAKKLREILNDSSRHPSASELIDEIVEVKNVDEKPEKHFFQVSLEGITAESDELLNLDEVIQYLQEVAPIPYTPSFIFKDTIHDFALKNKFRIDEYTVNINGRQLMKPYSADLYARTSNGKKKYDEVQNIDFKIFKNNSGKVIAWMWYGISSFEKQLNSVNRMRGIRLRKENIEIGDSTTLGNTKFFKETRGNYYFIGELFAIDKDLIPNARRDYFNANFALKSFESIIKPVLYNELYTLYYGASKYKNDYKAIIDFNAKRKEFIEKSEKGQFINKSEQETEQNNLKKFQERAQKAQKDIDSKSKRAEKNDSLKKVYHCIEKTYKPQAADSPNSLSTKVDISQSEVQAKYKTSVLSSYSKKERKLISKIYQIIKDVLDPDTAEDLVNKIQEELKK